MGEMGGRQMVGVTVSWQRVGGMDGGVIGRLQRVGAMGGRVMDRFERVRCMGGYHILQRVGSKSK